MNTHAAQLAASFELANGEVIAFVERLSDAEWRMPCEREGRAVGVVVCHIAAGHRIIGEQMDAIAKGLPPPSLGIASAKDAARSNAEQAAEYADYTRDETIDLLRSNGPWSLPC